MKRTLFTIALLLTFVVGLQAQWTSNYYPQVKTTGDFVEYRLKGQLDSTLTGSYTSLTSGIVEPGDFSSLEYISGSYDNATATGKTAGKIYCNLQGSNDNSGWVTLAQIIDTTTGVAYAHFPATALSNIRTKYWRFVIGNAATGGDNCTFDIIARIKRK